MNRLMISMTIKRPLTFKRIFRSQFKGRALLFDSCVTVTLAKIVSFLVRPKINVNDLFLELPNLWFTYERSIFDRQNVLD